MQPQSKIQLLPEHIIDQIKAGEVIERPSSLIKELIENALDANATQIQIHIIEQGLKLIEVSDNGQGMEYHDLPFAFCRHATSKISSFEDLYRLYSFGFRGEALASMASISKITCVSHTKNGTGGKIVINGGAQELHVNDEAKSPGTSFYVRDLFFNTPVRLKFIKSKNSEQNAIKKIIEAFLICYPQIEFHVRFDDKDKEIYKPQDRVKRLCDIYHIKNLDENAKIELNKQYLENSLELLLIAEDALRSSQKFQFIFVNNRLIVDRQIHAVINSFAESLIPSFKFNNYVLFLKVSPDELDANVHPNKTFVKFKNFGAILGLVSASLKNFSSVANEAAQNALPLIKAPFNTQSTSTEFKDLNSTETELYEAETTKHLALAPLIFLVQKNAQYYLLHLNQLMINYVKVKNQVPQVLLETTPILISEPYDLKTTFQRIADDLAKIGFEFDRLSEHSIVLRSLPEWLVPLNYKQFLFHYFNWAQKDQKKSADLLNFVQTALPPEFFDAKTKSFLVQEFCENNDEKNVLPQGVLCLDMETLNQLFK